MFVFEKINISYTNVIVTDFLLFTPLFITFKYEFIDGLLSLSIIIISQFLLQ